MSRYDLLLLDFGGVCLLNPVEMHDVAEAKLGLPAGTFTWTGPVDPGADDLYRQLTLENGLNEREYWTRRAAEVGAAAGQAMSLTDYMNLLYHPPSDSLIRPDCTAVVARARAAGVAVSVLTNDLRTFHGDTWERGITLLRTVDAIVDCSDTGVLKPDPRAYERAIAVTGAAADRILFVDDQPLNIDGARAVGMDALWFDIAEPERSWRGVAQELGL